MILPFWCRRAKGELKMTTIKREDCIGYADSIKIIFDKKCVEIFLEKERYLDFTFEEVMQIAEKNGWNDSPLLLIAESPLDGKIYQYGNYGDYWVEHGTTKGYA